MKRPPRVLIVTTINWAATAQLGLALTSKSFEVATVAPADHGIRKVGAINVHYRSISYSAKPSFIEWAIEQWQPDVVIPCDDIATCRLHALHSRAVRGDGHDPGTIKAIIESSLGKPTSYSIAEKKSDFMAFAKGQELLVPDTVVVQNAKDLAERLDAADFPLVLKLDSTSSGLGVRIVHNKDEAQSAYHELVSMFGWRRATKRAIKELGLGPLMHRWKESIPRITLQRFIGGVPASSAVLCWNGEVVAGISVEAIKTIHATGPATVVRILDNAEIVEVTRHVVERLGLSGFVGFDFILDETSGRPFLIEMNPRPTPISHLSLGIETDLVGALKMKLTAAKPTKPQMESAPGKIIALFPGEFWRDPKSDYLLSCHHDAPWDQPELIDEYTRPSSPHTLSWISRLIYQMFESLPWVSHEHRA
jgi:hypothetical protein